MDNQNTPMTNEELEQILEETSPEATTPAPAPEASSGADIPESSEATRKFPWKFNWKIDWKLLWKFDKKYRPVYLILLAIFAAAFLISSVYLISYWTDSWKHQKEDSDLADVVASIKAEQASGNEATKPQPTYPTGVPINPEETEPVAKDILPEYQPIFEMNNDLVGWIKVEGTKIDYPVVQSSMDNKNYYIDHTFEGEKKDRGAIYVRESCDVFKPSDNVTMYGHHMKNMTMFAGIDYYKKQSFWEEHQYFTFDTLYEHHTYQVMAIFKTSANPGQGFSYHQFENAASKLEFDEFVDTIKSLAMYDTGVTAEYGDKLVCLSTCEYTLDNGRLVLVGKRIS